MCYHQLGVVEDLETERRGEEKECEKRREEETALEQDIIALEHYGGTDSL